MGAVREMAQQAKQKADNNEHKIKELTKNLARQSDRQRRRNIIIAGISEEITPMQLEQTLCQFFKENGVQVEQAEIERAHRLYKKQRGGEPRQVIIAFAREKLKDEVFSTLRRVKDLMFQGKKIFVSHDFSQETLQEKRRLKPYAHKLYKEGINFTWGYPITLIVFRDGKRYRARNPTEAKKMLNELGVDASNCEEGEMEYDSNPNEEGEEPRPHSSKRYRTDSRDASN
ncbi:PREDICTED: uncharacterized protein LOC107114007 [Gekko japonicus]|uniref:Uncharacterized protein LOC107114007 n=1 Tax=Gekko japonicus TaxID=146911 RepID=A0ABM1KB25_GEKJA|nr:PREDICTED: uncharacterized protein LOC107114007 [Gekko japonicus]XP_015270912.1 PREDICTED: uncharacterized protein LOC107114007 [Gekko japonicus]